mmetsp:Transcript_24530/g.56539  ORF Transcript_24530/g.56539 Transcript_24530/m.56539 type:complete len:614 (-) Transcript_24530:55-1896(-)
MPHSSLLICCCVIGTAAGLEPHSLLVVRQDLQNKTQVSEAGRWEPKEARSGQHSSLQQPKQLLSTVATVEEVLCRLRGLAAGKELIRQVHGESRPSKAAQRCAVVSNSGVLLQHHYGEEIDASDRIFRFNDAVIGDNFSSSVGSREDIRVLNKGVGREMLNRSLSQADDATYLFVRHTSDIEVAQVQSWGNQAAGPVWVGTHEVGSLAQQMLSFDEFTMFGGVGGEANPTTGTLAMFIAMSMCEEVRAYGFALTSASYVAPYHYYGDAVGTAAHGQCCAHPSYFEEKDVWAHLSLSPHTDDTDVSVLPGFQQMVSCRTDGTHAGSLLSSADEEVQPAGYVPFRSPPKLTAETAKAATIADLAERFHNLSSLEAQDMYATAPASEQRNGPFPIPNASRCAVVSSSGSMLSHHYGAEIDATDLVFRFNDAPIGGDLADQVGSREDVRILNRLNGEKFMANDSKRMAQGVVYVLSRHSPDEAQSRWNINGDERFVFNRRGINGKSPEEAATLMMWLEFREQAVVDNPTTGMMGMMLAMTLCDEVRAYGFPVTTGNAKAPFHYYGLQKFLRADRNFEHEVAGFEKELWRRVATNSDVDEADVSVVPGFKRLNGSSHS